jgi:glutamate synthase (ferredoxin)
VATRAVVRNVDRSVGTLIGFEVTRHHGDALPHDTVVVGCEGTAGQSFGGFLPKGVTLRIDGAVNDFLGKGLSGGRLVVRPPAGATFLEGGDVVVGNVALYGATSGEAFIRGAAGQRFAVRNSGAVAVVEGVGDHGCEYMTGGCVLVLGPTGRNFAAGMSGGVAYVFDPDGRFRPRCNLDLVDLDPLDADDDLPIVRMLSAHIEQTGSTVASMLLLDWSRARRSFVRVIPREYRAALATSPAHVLPAARPAAAWSAHG